MVEKIEGISDFNIATFVARTRHADAIMGRLSDPKNVEMYQELLTQLGNPDKYHSIDLYTVEVALAHLIPTIMFLKLNGIDDCELKKKIIVIRNALAHAGETIKIDGQEKANIEYKINGGIIFRTRNGNQSVSFANSEKLAGFISEVNKVFSEALPLSKLSGTTVALTPFKRL